MSVNRTGAYCIQCDTSEGELYLRPKIERVTVCNFCTYNRNLAKIFENVFDKAPNTDDIFSEYRKLHRIIAPDRTKGEFQFFELSNQEIDRIKLLAGPHGKTIIKIMEARKNEHLKS